MVTWGAGEGFVTGGDLRGAERGGGATVRGRGLPLALRAGGLTGWMALKRTEIEGRIGGRGALPMCCGTGGGVRREAMNEAFYPLLPDGADAGSRGIRENVLS